MKRLILLSLILLFLATTFRSDSSGGWVQQTLPVNKLVNDIYFTDSLTGWCVTTGGSTSTDTGYVLKTIDGGNSWIIQLDSAFKYYAVQFLNVNTGYAAGGTGRAKFLKTTNSGNSWATTTPFGSNMYAILDIYFVNTDTGWVCGDDSFGGGVYKTTNGGINWSQQLNNTYRPLKIFFINKDTGWVGTNDINGRLYRTTNGGSNWILQYTSNFAVQGLFFLNNLKGWLRGGTGNGVMYTTDGGFTWLNSQGNTAAGFDLRFVNDSIGYSGMQSFRIPKSTDGGKTWGYQTSPIQNNMSVYMFRGDSLGGWAGGTGIVRTTDGGGPITYVGISPSSTIVPSFKLLQNYPNPFNPSTSIDFEVKKNSRISLRMFSVDGREVDELLDYEKFTTGSYYVKYEASNRLASGVYFYQMTGWTDDGKEIFIDTKKMLLIK